MKAEKYFSGAGGTKLGRKGAHMPKAAKAGTGTPKSARIPTASGDATPSNGRMKSEMQGKHGSNANVVGTKAKTFC